jgi:SAM-dependent methyltransferase
MIVQVRASHTHSKGGAELSDKSPVLNPSDAERVIRRYQRRIAEYGPTFESLNSGSIEKQRVRHQVHASALRGACPSLLDVGCGLASFYEYLTQEGRDCEYAGYDIVPEYVDLCRTRFAECKFRLRNILTDGIDGVFDTVVMSQTWNNRYQESDNVQVMEAVLRAAFDATRVSVSVDMLSSYADLRRPEVFYYSPEEMFAFAKTIARRVVLRHDYRSFEFCIQLFHDDVEGFVP